jgi:hypothetical protein
MGSRLIRTCTVSTPGLWWLVSTGRTSRGNNYVLFWVRRWPCSFWLRKHCAREERVSVFGSHGGGTAEIVLVGKVYTSPRSSKIYSNSLCSWIWMSYGMDLIISVLFSKMVWKNGFKKVRQLRCVLWWIGSPVAIFWKLKPMENYLDSWMV